jgi:NADPH-dependent 2,4-dienoyl-CoA reductase/sulfur reductase-like enzyme
LIIRKGIAEKNKSLILTPIKQSYWKHTMPLKVIIVGAGLGGLAAAITFTKAGHDVQVGFC